MIYNVAIIGAGAAGLYAGANAAPLKDFIIIEKNAAAGRKLLLTGAGQCNLTHGGPIQDFLTHYGQAGHRLRPVLFPYNNQAVMEFFRSQGVPLIQREDGKVFPASFKSVDIRDALLHSCQKAGGCFRFSASVQALFPCKVDREQTLWNIRIQSEQSIETIQARRVIVAAGGRSFPDTGSDGNLFPLLEKLKIPIVPPRPALTPIYVQGYPFGSLAGISLPDTRLALRHSGKQSIQVTGSTLLTHSGFSGPGILSLSRCLTTGDELSVSWLAPSIESSLSQALKSPSPEDGNKQISTVLTAFTGLPHRFVEQLCLRAQAAPEEKLSQLSASKRKAILSHLFRNSYSVSGLGGFSAAMVTAGGVSLDSVHLKTMESTLYPGLYFAGEILDVDGDTGGYNLQFAFSSGFAAIRSACGALDRQLFSKK